MILESTHDSTLCRIQPLHRVCVFHLYRLSSQLYVRLYLFRVLINKSSKGNLRVYLQLKITEYRTQELTNRVGYECRTSFLDKYSPHPEQNLTFQSMGDIFGPPCFSPITETRRDSDMKFRITLNEYLAHMCKISDMYIQGQVRSR